MKKDIRMGASVVLLALLVVAGLSSQESPSQPQAAVQPSAAEQAALQELFRTIDPQQRLALVEKFLAQFPESPLQGQAYLAAAEAYQRQGNLAKAVEYGERALETSPRYVAAMMVVAEALTISAVPTQADYEEKLVKAEDYGRRALEILPDFFEAAKAQRRPDVPEEQYKLQEEYMLALAHGTLGFIYLRRHQYAQAEEELKLATELNQWRPDPVDFQRLGFAQMRQKEYQEAEAAFQRCVELGGSASSICQKRLEHVQRILKVQQTANEDTPKE